LAKDGDVSACCHHAVDGTGQDLNESSLGGPRSQDEEHGG